MFKKYWILLLALCLTGFLTACRQTTSLYTVKSPDGKIEVSLEQIQDKATYAVRYNGTLVIQPSPLGLITSDNDLFSTLQLKNITGTAAITDEYTLWTGKKTNITYHANKAVVQLENKEKQVLEITFQVSNDGVAFRYHLANDENKTITITEEKTGFVFDSTVKAFLQPMQTAKTGFEQTNPAYEDNYRQNIPVGTASPNNNGWVYPALFQQKEAWVLITEAGMDGTYCGTKLFNQPDSNTYHIAFPDPRETMAENGILPVSSTSFYSPWRVITIGSLATIIESTLGTDLATAAAKKDYSFVKPGIASWSWIMSKDDFITYEEQKKYIDFAADMNWAYCLIDASWDTKIGYDKIKELAAYARQKGVALLLWYNSAGNWNTVKMTPKDKMLTHESRVSEFKLLNEMGVKGVKIDFFGGDGRSVINYYLDILKDAADYGILVNFHGATLPRGWSRTYPNLLTAEAVKGFEMITFNQNDADKEANHSAMLPFTRNAFDPMDFTSVNLHEITFSQSKRKTTAAFQLATSVIFLSGIHHIAESAEGMSHVPAGVKTFLRQLPVQWDDVKFISGFPGKEVVLARKAGDKWYVAGINGEAEAKTISLDLSVFKKQKATLFADGKGLPDFDISSALPNSIKTVNVQPNGGFLIVLE